jgi:hypothetical protein
LYASQHEQNMNRLAAERVFLSRLDFVGEESVGWSVEDQGAFITPPSMTMPADV